MYQKIINKIIELGDCLPVISGRVPDIGKNKLWLTQKDIQIESELADVIKTFSGSHSIYAEELHDVFIKEDNIWVIDPISNTVNFIHGMPHYSIVLSHLHKGKIKFAVIYDPSNKELFTAEKGKGAFLNNRRIHVSSCKENIVFLIGPRFSSPHRKKALKIIGEMSDNGSTMRNIGSLGLHYAYVACGRAEAAISFNKDTFPEFAGKLIVEEAGGRFTDFEGGALRPETTGVIASNGLVHKGIKDIVGA